MRNAKFSLILAVFLALALFGAYPSFAANVRATFGNKDSTNKYTLEEKSDNVVYVRPTGGIRYPYEKATTNDTITTQETGKTFVVDPNTLNDVTFVLPDAEVGMEFTFTAIDGAGAAEQIVLNPEDADTFRALVNSSAANTLAAGDSIKSPGVTGDSVKIKCHEAGYWDIIDIRGTWTDNN